MKMANIDGIVVGDSATCDAIFGEAQIQAFADLSHDVNPLHLDRRVSAALGFAGPVAHGMLAMGVISRLIGTELPGAGSLWVSHEIQFPSAVLAGDRVTATVTVTQISRSAGLVSLRAEAVNQTTGAVVLRGTARVKVLPGAAADLTNREQSDAGRSLS